MSDYKKTLCLPATQFPMKANLVQKEVEILSFWDTHSIYAKMIQKNEGNVPYILHDGPPYANGHIHLGTALNKILKDIIVKSRSMQGYYSPYIPGWDCHGLPIELQVEQSLKEKNKSNLSPIVIRSICREHANKFIEIQKKEFKRLGVFADWNTIYKTMNPEYEGAIIELTAMLKERGNIVQSKKPIYWCCSCKTALAEAEVEYHDHTIQSIFVAFPIPEATAIPHAGTLFAVIWTTTPWTLPSNMAIAVHSDIIYAVVEHKGNSYLIADELVEHCAKQFAFEDYTITTTLEGKSLEGIQAKHPLYDRASPIVLAPYVTIESGTGLVHTAPGHGREDYETGLRYNLPIYSPIDDEGFYTEDVELFAGKNISEANSLIIEALKKHNVLLEVSTLRHSYPHCWRCRKPVIFRATKQWFVSLDVNDLRKKALFDIQNRVAWIPTWGESRIYSMVENRPDWCISRQRIWGVPIVALHCVKCSATYNDVEFIRAIANASSAHKTGSDIWYEKSVTEIINEFIPDLTCACGSKEFTKEMDILDVWFDSASSFYAVVKNEANSLSFPADLYLEGSDQHRGWFHSSLLVAEGTFDSAPYKNVVTHGYVVDGKGHKMSKSVGNVVAPEEIISKYGAEILRLWVASVEYKEDVRISDEILSRLVEAYRRIRNTCRYMLGNLAHFTKEDALDFMDLDPLDRYALASVYKHHRKMQEAYTYFEFHKVFHTLYATCTTELSALYFDILKDRLYSYAPTSKERRSAQTALYYILQMIVLDMAPILSFTAEEVWGYLAVNDNSLESVFLANMNTLPEYTLSEAEYLLWEKIVYIRALLTKAIEPLRVAGTVGHSLDTSVHIYTENAKEILSCATDLRAFFIVSSLKISPLEDCPPSAIETEDATVSFIITRAEGEKCERCWIYSTELGSNTAYSTLCPRCTNVLVGEC